MFCNLKTQNIPEQYNPLFYKAMFQLFYCSGKFCVFGKTQFGEASRHMQFQKSHEMVYIYIYRTIEQMEHGHINQALILFLIVLCF